MKILFIFCLLSSSPWFIHKTTVQELIFYNLTTYYMNGSILQIGKILVPFDNSGYSKRSLKYAVDLAKVILSDNRGKEHIRIFLLHVVQEFPIAKSLSDRLLRDKEGKVISLSQYASAIYDGMKDNMEKSLSKEISKYSSIDGVKIDFAILSGDPANVIVDYTEKNKIDLVIMGSNGLQGLAKFKGLGNVSRKVSEAVSCLITIIR